MDNQAALSYEPHTPLGDPTWLLVVDDVFNDGKTVAAMISRLRDDGLSPETTTTVAVALYVPRAS
jgi:hypoxanthine phosphoribosyltransferase